MLEKLEVHYSIKSISIYLYRMYLRSSRWLPDTDDDDDDNGRNKICATNDNAEHNNMFLP